MTAPRLHPWIVAFALSCSGGVSNPHFPVLSVIDVGLNPHQIAFTEAGATAWIAAAGSDHLTEVHGTTHEVLRRLAVDSTPLGVAVLPDGISLAVTRFGGESVARVALADGATMAVRETGGAPSLIAGPVGDGGYLISVERANRLWVLDPDGFTLRTSFSTGARPFPPSATVDGRTAFVPNYDDGTVTVIDLMAEETVATVEVGVRPSGGALVNASTLYAVAVRGDNKVAFIDVDTHTVVDSLVEGIGESPFSVVPTPDGRWAFVNNTVSHDISVIDLAQRRVVQRIPVGEQPIVMAVHPSGSSLWVSSEGSDELTVFAIP